MPIEKSGNEQIEDLGLVKLVRPDFNVPASGKVSPFTRRNLLRASVIASTAITVASVHRVVHALPSGGAFLYASMRGYSGTLGQYWVEPNGSACFNVWDSPSRLAFFDTVCQDFSGSITYSGIFDYFDGTINVSDNGIAGSLIFTNSCFQCYFQ